MLSDKKSHTGELDLSGLRFEYQWVAPAQSDRPTLVLLHEGLGCVAMWKDVPERLAAATACGVLVYSRAGYGASSSVSLPRATRYMHDEALVTLPALIEATGLTSFVLVGHSDGGSISIIYAGGAQAKGLQGVVLLAPHVFNEAVCVASARAARRAYQETSLRDALENYHGDQVDIAFYGWNDVWLSDEFWHWNIEEYLSRINVPVLVLQGREDEYGTTAQIEAIRAGLPADGEFDALLIDKCGHSPQRDAPELVDQALAQFIERLA